MSPADHTNQAFDLDRFVTAQTITYGDAVHELQTGVKRSHWMWFVFPQIEGLGSGPTARHYAIKSLDEARAYLAHPILGSRLLECTRIVNDLQGLSALEIFGTPDNLKFRSSMTLFEFADRSEPAFAAALEKFFSGERDSSTVQLLQLAAQD